MIQAFAAPGARALSVWHALERRFDRVFGSLLNPLRQLGTLGFLAFWVLAVSGIWLYAVLDTSVTGAYASVERLSNAPWSPGGLMRSLHRYAADAFVLFTGLHLLRETIYKRWRHFRLFTWFTGSALLPLVAVSAIGGFWLNWDRLGQFSAIATAEWLDALPLLANPLARNFLGVESVSDRLFSLFVFVHLGVPLLLLFGLWFHIQRLTRAAVFPPRALALGTLTALLLLAIFSPVSSQGPADLARVPVPLSLDWILLFAHPLMYATSAGFTWALTLGLFAVLLILPLLPAATRSPVAVVDPVNCNGCRRCFADCPYAAITMVPHPNGRPGRQLARIDQDLCAGCGICAGSCYVSTSMPRTSALPIGIDIPQFGAAARYRQLREGLDALQAPQRIVLFGCAQGADVGTFVAPDVLALPFTCIGELPPSFIDHALRDGAAGVVVASCPGGGCTFRLGAQWTADRLQGTREPRLHVRVPRERVQLVEAGSGDEARVHVALAAMRDGLTAFETGIQQTQGTQHG